MDHKVELKEPKAYFEFWKKNKAYHDKMMDKTSTRNPLLKVIFHSSRIMTNLISDWVDYCPNCKKPCEVI